MTPLDHLVVLTSMTHLATKRVTPAGIEDYPKGSKYFAFREQPISSFDDLADALTRLQAQPYSFVVRGSIIPGTN